MVLISTRVRLVNMAILATKFDGALFSVVIGGEDEIGRIDDVVFSTVEGALNDGTQTTLVLVIKRNPVKRELRLGRRSREIDKEILHR